MLLLYAALTVLGVVFDFPEILRKPAAERLDLFARHAGIVRPTYWLLALTGFTQISMTVLLAQSLPARGRTVVLFGLIFGVLAGALQTLGFIRWAVLIPYLAQAMSDPAVPDLTRQAIALVEGSFNRYAGMAVGEHTATLCLAVWTLCLGLALRGPAPVDRRLGTMGVFLAPVAVLVALEPLGVAGPVPGLLGDVAFPAWIVWLVVIAASLWRADARTAVGPRLTWRTAVWGAVLYGILAGPQLVA